MRSRLVSITLMIATVAACGATARHEPRPIWHDEFSGAAGRSPSATKWAFETAGNGLGTGELECNTDQNAILDGRGHLVVTARRDPGHLCADGSVNDYTSARLSTAPHFAATHGTIAMRAKVPSGVGTWSAFWSLGTSYAQEGWPRSGEMDVMENVGRSPRDVVGTVHGPQYADPSQQAYLSRTTTYRRRLSSSFHVYTMRWRRSSVTWLLDGRVYGKVTKAQVEKTGPWVLDRPFYLLIDLAVGGNFGGPVPATTTWPQRLVVDWVRVYRS